MSLRLVYSLFHFHLGAGEAWDTLDPAVGWKPLGKFATRAEAEALIGRRLALEGFRDWPDGFRVVVLRLDEDRAEECWHCADPDPPSAEQEKCAIAPPAVIHQLEHFDMGPEEDLPASGEETGKLLGVYSSRGAAEAALRRFSAHPALARFPGGFRIFSSGLGREAWETGFISK